LLHDCRPPSRVLSLQKKRTYLRLPHTETRCFCQQNKPDMCMSGAHYQLKREPRLAVTATLKDLLVHLKMEN
jgi:hypothetical protein